jgi:hypothetical protein
VRRSRLAAVFLSLVFACGLEASVTERAIGIAEKFAETALRETYKVGAMTLSVRTAQYTAGAKPERFWITVSSQAAPCDRAGTEEIGEFTCSLSRIVFRAFSGCRTVIPRFEQPR